MDFSEKTPSLLFRTRCCLTSAARAKVTVKMHRMGHRAAQKSLVLVPSKALKSRDAHRGLQRHSASQTCISRFGELSCWLCCLTNMGDSHLTCHEKMGKTAQCLNFSTLRTPTIALLYRLMFFRHRNAIATTSAHAPYCSGIQQGGRRYRSSSCPSGGRRTIGGYRSSGIATRGVESH